MMPVLSPCGFCTIKCAELWIKGLSLRVCVCGVTHNDCENKTNAVSLKEGIGIVMGSLCVQNVLKDSSPL